MADLNKFHRSKERITEILNYLMNTSEGDQVKKQYIGKLQQSIRLIDEKIEKFNSTPIVNKRKVA